MPKNEQGVFSDRYNVIPRTLIFITQGDRVLLIKGAPTKRLWANQFNGIGGHVERGEDLLSAARREVFEETGLVVDRLRLCGTLIVDSDPHTGICIFIYKGEYQGGTINPSPEGSLVWVGLEDLGQLPLVEDLQVILPRVLAQADQQPPFSARSDYDREDRLRLEFQD